MHRNQLSTVQCVTRIFVLKIPETPKITSKTRSCIKLSLLL